MMLYCDIAVLLCTGQHAAAPDPVCIQPELPCKRSGGAVAAAGHAAAAAPGLPGHATALDVQ